jgi:DNA-binding GntR family transcriptional regulator
MDFSVLQDFKSTKPVSMKAHITDAIRNAIIEGKLKPGQQLQQDKIAAALGASTIPVREALATLEEERHIVYHRNRGAFVSEIDAEKAREAYEIRFFLESGALSLSLPNIQPLDLDAAESLMNREADANNAIEKVRLDLAFHLALCKPCGRDHLMGLIEQIHGHVARYVNLSIYLMDFKRHTKYNHATIFEACRKRDVAAATEVLKNHFRVATEIICAKFET